MGTIALHLGPHAATAAAGGGGFVGWLLQQMANVAGGIVAFLLSLIGWLLWELVRVALLDLFLPLLRATIFNPVTLTGANPATDPVAVMAGWFWRVTAAVSGGVALLGLLWGGFLRMGGGLFAERRPWQEMGEGLGIWVLTLAGGYTFLATLLGVLDQGVRTLNTDVVRVLDHLFTQTASGVSLSLAGIVGYFFVPLLWSVFGIVLVWVIFAWLSRLVDLIVFVGLLPLTAALAVSGNKQPFRWNWQEAEGAVFAQIGMALLFWVAWTLLQITFFNVQQGYQLAAVTKTPAALTGLGMGIVALTMVARVPDMLQNLTGHRQAGVLSMALGFAGARMASNSIMGAYQRSRAGQAAQQIQAGTAAASAAQVTGWANLSSLSARAGAALDRVPAVRQARQHVQQGRRAVNDRVHGWRTSDNALVRAGGALAGVSLGLADAGQRAGRALVDLPLSPRAHLGRAAAVARGQTEATTVAQAVAQRDAAAAALGPALAPAVAPLPGERAVTPSGGSPQAGGAPAAKAASAAEAPGAVVAAAYAATGLTRAPDGTPITDRPGTPSTFHHVARARATGQLITPTGQPYRPPARRTPKPPVAPAEAGPVVYD